MSDRKRAATTVKKAKIKNRKAVIDSKRGQSVNITFRVPVDLVDDLNKICEREGVVRNAVCVELIRQFVEGTK